MLLAGRMRRSEPRVEECMRCGFPAVFEQDAADKWSSYSCPMCGNEWAWRRG